MVTRLGRWMVVVSVLLLMVGCGSDAAVTVDTADPAEQPPTEAVDEGTDAAADGTVIELIDFEIVAPATAPPGTFVVRNTGNAPHTFTADDGSVDTGTVAPGEEASVTIEATGPLAYRCTIHPAQMQGTIDLQ